MYSCLFRLIDKRAGAISVNNFLRFVQRHAKVLPHASIEAVEERVARDRVILDELQPQLKGLRERRNKIGAHVSFEYLPDLRQIGNEYPLDETGIEAVIQGLTSFWAIIMSSVTVRNMYLQRMINFSMRMPLRR